MEKAVTEDLKNSLEAMLTAERINRIDTVLAHRTRNITVVLDRVYHEHNISAVLRSADAFGIQRVHLIGKGFSSQRGISLGTERWVEVEQREEAKELVDKLKGESFKLVSLVPPLAKDQMGTNRIEKEPVPVLSLPFDQKLAFVFGSEGEGISEDLYLNCDIPAYIPMFGFVESLNVSVACALTLYSAFIAKGEFEQKAKTLTAEEKSDLRWDWIKKSVANSDIVISELQKREQA